jgi:hypothetical protein
MKTFATALSLSLVVFIAGSAQAQTTDDDEDVQSAPPKDEKGKKGKKDKKEKAKKDDKGKKEDKGGKAGAGGSVEAGAEFGAGGEVTGGVESEGTGTLSDTGEEENPNAPVTGMEGGGAAEVGTSKSVEPVARGPYPLAYVDRPLTLYRRMTEVSLDLPNSFNSYVQNVVLAAQHGVTDEIELGIRYGAMSFVAIDGETDTFGGKTFAIEAQYAVFPWLAPQISVPMLVDPYSVAVSFGPEMQFTFFDKLRIFGLRDLFTIRIHRLIPSVTSPVDTATFVALDETETDLPAGGMNVSGGVDYQFQENAAVEARVGVQTFFDSQTDATDRDPLLFDLGIIYSTSNMIDIGGRIGWSDVNRADETFGVWAFGAFRI